MSFLLWRRFFNIILGNKFQPLQNTMKIADKILMKSTCTFPVTSISMVLAQHDKIPTFVFTNVKFLFKAANKCNFYDINESNFPRLNNNHFNKKIYQWDK